MTTKIGRPRKITTFIGILFIMLISLSVKCSAASVEFKQIYSSSYERIGNAKTKSKYSNGKTVIYFKKNGKTYRKRISDMAVTDGSMVYYTDNGKLYKWNPVKGKDKKIGKMNGYLVGGTGNILCFERSYGDGNEAERKLYRYNLNTQNSKLIKKDAFYIGVSGKNIIFEGSHGDPSPSALYVFNISSKKTTKVCSRQRGTTVTGNYLYYAQYTGRGSGYSIFTIKRYNLNTGKKKTLAKNVHANAIYEITNQYAMGYTYYSGKNYWYKYMYSTGEYVMIDSPA